MRTPFVVLAAMAAACGGNAARPEMAPTHGSLAAAAAPASTPSPDSATNAQPNTDPTAPATPDGNANATPTPAGPATGTIKGSVEVKPQALAFNGDNVVVWIDDPVSAPAPNDHGASATLDQRGMFFVPILTTVRTGGKVTFANGDPFPHNIFTRDNEKFDLGTMPRGATSTRTFNAPGHYTLLCNLHPNMIAWILVTPSGWFTHAAKDGSFALTGVPNGTYKVKAWGGRLREDAQTVTVNGGEVTAQFHLKRAD